MSKDVPVRPVRCAAGPARSMAAFTLIEVLFAFAVLAIGLLGVSLYFSNATLFQRFGSEYSIANSAANAVLE